MITEQELELALELRNKIKELKTVMAKLENVVVSNTNNLSNGISIDGNRVIVDGYTKTLLMKFKDDVLSAYEKKLEDLKEKYKEIIESPNDALRRILEENG